MNNRKPTKEQCETGIALCTKYLNEANAEMARMYCGVIDIARLQELKKIVKDTQLGITLWQEDLDNLEK